MSTNSSQTPGPTGSKAVDYLFVLVWIVLLLLLLAMAFLSLMSFEFIGRGQAWLTTWNLLATGVLAFATMRAWQMHEQRFGENAAARSRSWLYVLALPALTLFVWTGGCVISESRLY